MSRASTLLPKTWRSRAALWASSACWSLRDWFATQDERQPRKPRALLDLEPLEKREVPAYTLTAISYPVSDAFRAASVQVGDTTVGLLDGNASVCPPSGKSCRFLALKV